MKSPSNPKLGSDDGGVATVAPASVAEGGEAADRRKAPRTKTVKSGTIVLGTGAPVDCTVREISQTGAVLEVQIAIQQETFDLTFDGAGWPPRSCRVVWKEPPRIGVEFMTMGALLDGYDAARQRRYAQLAERHRKEEAIDHELHEAVSLIGQAAKFLQDNEVSYEIVNRTLRIAHQRAPLIAVHYNPEAQRYETTFMPDGSQATAASPEECVKGIGELLFKVLTHT
jgi:hypothetical protein